MAKLKVAEALLRARKYESSGEVEKAIAIYQSILSVYPKNARARKACARLDRANRSPIKDQMLHPTKAQIDAVVAEIQSGALGSAAQKGEALLESYPTSFELWNITGAAYKMAGDLNKAEHAFRTVCNLNPDLAEGHHNLGVVLLEQGNFSEATSAFKKTVEISPNFNGAHRKTGVAFIKQGKPDEALVWFEQATKLSPDDDTSYEYMGDIHKNKEKTEKSVYFYKKTVEKNHKNFQAYLKLGKALLALGETNEAATYYKKALDANPDNPKICARLGDAFSNLSMWSEALSAYQRLVGIDHNSDIGFNNMGVALKALGRKEDARQAYLKAIEISPSYSEAHRGLGALYGELKEFDKAISHYHAALEANPASAEAEVQMLHYMQFCCDWRNFSQMENICSRLGVTTGGVSPFPMLSMEDNPQRQLLRSQKWTREAFSFAQNPFLTKPRERPKRLRIGYFSADFFNHATLHLMMGMLQCHDTSRFEIFLYSYGQGKNDKMRTRASHVSEHFIDVSNMSDTEIVDLARSHQLDIAIDVKGYTMGARIEPFQIRLAPLQISFLAYPGTMAADFIDYMIADSTVIPESQRVHYTENVIFMPHSYQPNDNRREISPLPTERADFGLPEEGFVFCCFNNSYKISPREFDIWMRVIGKVENSVLWLFEANPWSVENLRKEAHARGVDPDRLVFAKKQPNAKHLARHKHADLFLDTFMYNAHTTTSDALWAGLPVVTKIGDQFAARVAASLLTFVGLPELITPTEEAYESLILELATHPGRLQKIREKLLANRLTQPLFDTERYTRSFEDGLRQAYDIWLEGAPPRDIWVEAKHR